MTESLEMAPYQTSFTAALFDSDLPPTTETLSFWRRLDLSVIGPLQSVFDLISFTREVEALRQDHGVPKDLPSLEESPDVLQLINTFFGFEVHNSELAAEAAILHAWDRFD